MAAFDSAVLPFCLAAITAAACTTHQSAAAFWFEPGAVVLPARVAAQIAGPLTSDETGSVQRAARAELARAFAAFDLAILNRPGGFWQVHVVREIEPNFPRVLPAAGRSVALGPFGGSGSVDFTMVALAAARYAPPGAARAAILDAVGRGIGRVAAHELGHQIAGVYAADDGSDEESYEYGSPDRAAQYYGELRWTRWRAPLEAKLGPAHEGTLIRSGR